ncbi:MAG: hypothetical protein PVG39_29820 [Desulfobacteraceae bacterium]|jgi:hypothetical protein
METSPYSVKTIFSKNLIFWECLFFFLGWFLFIGYPILFVDSWRYLASAIYLGTNQAASVFASYVLRIPVILFGPWGWALSQGLMLSYLLQASFRQLGLNNKWTVPILFVTSPIGVAAATVLTDIFCLIGLLSLYLILSGSRSWLVLSLFSLSFVAHFGNMPLFIVLSFLYWLLFARKNKKIIIRILLAMLAGVLAVVLVNWKLEDQPRLTGNSGWIFLASRILADSPKLFDDYLETHPNSAWAAGHSTFHNAIDKIDSQSKRIATILWDKHCLFLGMRGPRNIAREAKSFVFFSIINYPGLMIKYALINTWNFLKEPDYIHALLRDRTPLDHQVGTAFTQDMEMAKNSLQYSGRLICLVSQDWYIFWYYTSLAACLAMLIYFLAFHKTSLDDPVFQFCCFSSLALLLNAVFMSNLSGTFGRYQIRVLPLITIVLCSCYKPFIAKNIKP